MFYSVYLHSAYLIVFYSNNCVFSTAFFNFIFSFFESTDVMQTLRINTVDHLHAELHAGNRKCPELNLRNLDWFPVKK